MIERVAMAIYAKNAAAALGRQPWAKAQEETKESVRDLARAALEEMRVPTDEMCNAAYDHGKPDTEQYAENYYRTMINAALKEVS